MKQIKKIRSQRPETTRINKSTYKFPPDVAVVYPKLLSSHPPIAGYIPSLELAFLHLIPLLDCNGYEKEVRGRV